LTNKIKHKIILETPRLYLRETTPEDAVRAYELNLDPDVIRYTGDEPFKSAEAAREFLINYDHYRKYGFGRWAVINKTDDDFLGWCGLKYTPEKNEHDVGFRFFKRHWNKGYATEASRACIKYGFETLHLHTIVGRAMRENAASIRVLQKSGLNYWKEGTCGGEEGVIYKIESPD
jgi:ribosomal-protein-alanine N-acetyltransferase